MTSQLKQVWYPLLSRATLKTGAKQRQICTICWRYLISVYTISYQIFTCAELFKNSRRVNKQMFRTVDLGFYQEAEKKLMYQQKNKQTISIRVLKTLQFALRKNRLFCSFSKNKLLLSKDILSLKRIYTKKFFQEKFSTLLNERSRQARHGI